MTMIFSGLCREVDPFWKLSESMKVPCSELPLILAFVVSKVSASLMTSYILRRFHFFGLCREVDRFWKLICSSEAPFSEVPLYFKVNFPWH